MGCESATKIGRGGKKKNKTNYRMPYPTFRFSQEMLFVDVESVRKMISKYNKIIETLSVPEVSELKHKLLPAI